MKKLIEDIKRKATRFGIRVILKNQPLVFAPGENEGCSGFFDPENKILAVATKKKKEDWLGVLIHESCHLDQWVHDRYLWDKLSIGYNIFFKWLLDGKEVEMKVLERCVQDIIELEKDCEIRSIKKIQKYGINIDVERYRRLANAYLYSYIYMLGSRKWIPRIYDMVWTTAPKNFPKKHIKIPIKLYRAFKKAYGQT